jgi:hypothetical protein
MVDQGKAEALRELLKKISKIMGYEILGLG